MNTDNKVGTDGTADQLKTEVVNRASLIPRNHADIEAALHHDAVATADPASSSKRRYLIWNDVLVALMASDVHTTRLRLLCSSLCVF